MCSFFIFLPNYGTYSKRGGISHHVQGDRVFNIENGVMSNKVTHPIFFCSGGAVGLTENLTGFQRWMASGPGFARLLREFEEQYLSDYDSNNDKAPKHRASG